MPGIGTRRRPWHKRALRAWRIEFSQWSEHFREARHDVAAVRFWQTRTNKRISGPTAR